MGRSFPRFPLGEKAFVSHTLLSTPVLIFSSWVQLSDSISARGRSEELLLQLFSFKRDVRRRRGMSGRLKFSFGLCFLNSRFRFSNMSPDVCLALPQIGADTGVLSRE